MNLPFLTRKKENKEYFLTLILSNGKLSSILFEKTGQKLLILGASSKDFEGSLDSLSPQQLLELSDVVITGVEKHLPEGENFSKTIFAVPYHWVFEGKIVKEKLGVLKTLCDELRLTPVGFVVSIEALIAYLHRKEGAPVTAIFVEANEKQVGITIVKNGSILGVFDSPLEHDTAKTIDNLLLTQNVTEVLPPKIILLNFEHAKKIQQAVLTHSWSKSLSFLHIPQVDVLDEEAEAQAVIAGVVSQMGFSDIPEVHMKVIEKATAPIEIASQDVLSKEDVVVDDSTTDQEVVEDVVSSGVTIADSSESGFYKDRDVLEEEVVDAEKETENNITHVPHSLDAVGEEKNVEEDVDLEEEDAFRKPKFAFPAFSFPKFNMPKITNVFSKGKLPLLYPLIAVVLLIAAVVGYYFFYEKAEVVVVLDKREIEREENVVFALDKQTSVDDSVIKISEKEVTVEGNAQKAATGTKETGETAKGELTIYNKTDAKKVFPQGSVLIGPNNLLFELSDEVTVASTSPFSTTFSSAKGKVVASKFGKEYNLPSNTNFSFENQSTNNYFAKNDAAFSGGTKKEVKVVSASDINELTSKIVSDLTQKAIEQEKSSGNKDAQLLPQALDYSFDERTFSKKEGEEAENVSLTAALTLVLGYLEKDEISNFAKGVGGSDVPQSYKYSVADSSIEVEEIEVNEDGDFTGQVVMKSVFVPDVSISDFSQKVSGKSEGKVSEIITGDGIADSKVIFTRSLPFMPKVLPFKKENISVSLRLD